MDRVLTVLVLLAALLILLISVYSLIDNYRQYQAAKDPTLSAYKPVTDEGGAQILTEEKRITENQVAWLTISDTTIDYPVMQGEDNYEYLNKNPYGEFSLAGSIFLDCRSNPDFTDDYSLIHGHHMEHDSMFGALDDFRERSFFDAHKTGQLITADAVYEIHLFAVSDADGGDEIIFRPEGRTTSEILAFLSEHALIYEPVGEDRRLLCLATCYGDDLLDRMIVVGTLTPISETDPQEATAPPAPADPQEGEDAQ